MDGPEILVTMIIVFFVGYLVHDIERDLQRYHRNKGKDIKDWERLP